MTQEHELNDRQEDVSQTKASWNQSLGKRGEDVAVGFLERRGYEILERNWKCPFGEADIIARDGDDVLFIEVKTRTGVAKGLPEDAVTKEKRSRYEKIAASYSLNIEGYDTPIRFDVIAIVVIENKRALLRHHVNAFGCGD